MEREDINLSLRVYVEQTCAKMVSSALLEPTRRRASLYPLADASPPTDPFGSQDRASEPTRLSLGQVLAGFESSTESRRGRRLETVSRCEFNGVSSRLLLPEGLTVVRLSLQYIEEAARQMHHHQAEVKIEPKIEPKAESLEVGPFSHFLDR